MDKNDGGPAFPGRYWDGQKKADHFGMSLRDYFAAQALLGLIVNPQFSPDGCATRAYRVANAMIAERRREDESSE